MGNERIICRHCGMRGEKHRGGDAKCPAVTAWGVPKADPMSDWSLEGKALDRALATFWSGGTHYAPRA